MARKNSVAKRLVKWRWRKGYSQRQLAERADVSQAIISKLERGETRNPGWKTLCRLEVALGTDRGALTLGLPVD